MGIDLKLSKAQAKERVRWRGKLSEKQLSPEGSYVPQARDEAAWAQYLAFVTSQLSSSDFDALFDQLEKHLIEGREDDDESLNRKVLLECFAACDSHNKGRIALGTLAHIVGRSQVVNDKVLRRVVIKWRHQHDQRERDCAAVGHTEELPQADEETTISMLEAVEFLTELLRPRDGADRDVLFRARLEAVPKPARDKCT